MSAVESSSVRVPESIRVRNGLSGAERDLKVGRYIKNSFLVHWGEITAPIEIRRDRDGYFTSNPKSFFRQWHLTDESKQALTEAILGKRQEQRDRILNERYR